MGRGSIATVANIISHFTVLLPLSYRYFHLNYIYIYIYIYMGAKGVVRGPGGARLADNRVPTKLRKCHLFLSSPIHACPRHGPWATS